MSRRRRPSFSPFGFYADLALSGMRAGEMMMSSAEVIGYRSRMIADAMCGTTPHDDAEFTRMWQEKLHAGIDAYSAMLKHAGPLDFSPAGFGAMMRTMDAMALPYHAKVTANARRLRRKRPIA